MVKGKTLEDPYEYSKAAQKHENSGNRTDAELAFKKAIKAADALPMDEYKEHLRVVTRELKGESGGESGLSDQALDLEAVTGAYHELLSMPFLTRIQLAGFYARNNKLKEARQICNEAIDRGLDAETLRTPAVAIMDQRAAQLHHALNDVMGPDNAEQIFAELFSKLDANHDNFVDEEELRRALLDIEIDEDGHALVRFLLHNYENVMQSSKDQLWFADYLGISKADLKNYQKKQQSAGQWKTRLDA
jgi:hypothetical protein